MKEAGQRLSAENVLTHPWLNKTGPADLPLSTPQVIRRYVGLRLIQICDLCFPICRVFSIIFRLSTVAFSCRNNSARELSAFAESAMAVNRVVLQHFSMNLDMVRDGTEPQCGAGDMLSLSPPSESRLAQRRKAQSLSKSIALVAAAVVTSSSG